MSFRKHAFLLLTVTSFFSGVVLADDDPIVAKVGSHTIRRSEITAESLPEQLRGAFKNEKDAFVFLRELAVTQRVLLEAARTSGIQKDPEVQKTLKEVISKITDQASGQVLLQAFIEKNISKDTLVRDSKKAYEDYLKTVPKNAKEIKISHIVLKDESAAKNVITDLKNGIDFMKIAREKSLDQETGAQGGAFPNYIQEGQLIPDLSKAAFSLTPGTYTRIPVQSPLGWHVLKVTDKRTFKPKRFEEMREIFQSKIVNDRLKTLADTLKLKASIELFDQNGNPDTAVPSEKPSAL
jgi:peptidyl-prolyl cis-trans isomerase C